MKNPFIKRDIGTEKHNRSAALLKEFILGGQDGLVNVLGIILGIAIGTHDTRIVILAGLSATVAESVSMAAVSYTSSKAEEDYYNSEEKRELYEIEKYPDKERKEVEDIYYNKGFRGKLLNDIVKNICSDKKRWLEIMMKEELNLSKELSHPIKSAVLVFIAALIGSLIPLAPFFFIGINIAIIWSLVLAAISLFITGMIEAKLTVGNYIKKGFQLTLIGMSAALVGYFVGKFFA